MKTALLSAQAFPSKALWSAFAPPWSSPKRTPPPRRNSPPRPLSAAWPPSYPMTTIHRCLRPTCLLIAAPWAAPPLFPLPRAPRRGPRSLRRKPALLASLGSTAAIFPAPTSRCSRWKACAPGIIRAIINSRITVPSLSALARASRSSIPLLRPMASSGQCSVPHPRFRALAPRLRRRTLLSPMRLRPAIAATFAPSRNTRRRISAPSMASLPIISPRTISLPMATITARARPCSRAIPPHPPVCPICSALAR